MFADELTAQSAVQTGGLFRYVPVFDVENYFGVIEPLPPAGDGLWRSV
jgi:hypothetical protein